VNWNYGDDFSISATRDVIDFFHFSMLSTFDRSGPRCGFFFVVLEKLESNNYLISIWDRLESLCGL
jgi:hypothetical protein